MNDADVKKDENNGKTLNDKSTDDFSSELLLFVSKDSDKSCKGSLIWIVLYRYCGHISDTWNEKISLNYLIKKVDENSNDEFTSSLLLYPPVKSDEKNKNNEVNHQGKEIIYFEAYR